MDGVQHQSAIPVSLRPVSQSRLVCLIFFKVFIRVRPGRPAPGFKAGAGDESSIGSDLLFVPLPLLFQVDEERKTLVFEHEKTSPETLHSQCSRIIAFNNEARL